MANFSSLPAEVGSVVWGTPANFNGFASWLGYWLLHRCRSTEVTQTLHNVWPSPGLVHYIHVRGLLHPNGILSGAAFTLHPSLAFSYIGSVTARHSNSSGRQPNIAALSRRCHVYSAGRPSRWTSAHILVYATFHKALYGYPSRDNEELDVVLLQIY